MPDLPDYTRYIAFEVTVPDINIGPVLARPKGGVLEKASATTTGTYAKVTSHKPADGDTFQLAKILISCPEDIMIKLMWDNAVIGAEIFIQGKIPFTDWFPWNYHDMEGDDSKEFEIQAKFPSGGSAATCHAEIVGEDI